MKYQVPQFLEIEDKIFGPFTLKQFLYAGAGIAIGFVFWTTFPRFLAILLGAPFVSLFFGLAFWKVNDRPLVVAIEHFFKYLFAPKLYLWKKREKTPEKQAAEVIQRASLDVPKLSNSKLKDLSWGLDIHETLKTLDDINPKQ